MTVEAPRSRSRVLIAAFVLPHTVEFRGDEAEGYDHATAQGSAPHSPVSRTDNTDQLADLLSSRLQLAVTQQQERNVRPFLSNSERRESTHHSRHESVAQYEHLSRAEIMAEAASSNTTSNLMVSGSAVISEPTSPAAVDLMQTQGQAASTQQGAAVSEAVTSSPAVTSEPASRGFSSRRNSGNALLPTFLPNQLMRNPTSHHEVQRPSTQHTLRDVKAVPPASIISDLATKQSQSTSMTPATRDQNPFGAGSLTPAPPGQQGRGHPTPLLMERPELASGWSGACDGQNASLRPVDHAMHQRTSSHQRPSNAPNRAPNPRKASPRPSQMERKRNSPNLQDESPEYQQDSHPDFSEKGEHSSHAPNSSPTQLSRHTARPGNIETTASATLQRRGSHLRRVSQRMNSMRSCSCSYIGGMDDEEMPPFVFVPNPGANYGLINALNSIQDQLPSESRVYIGTLGIEMDWVPTNLRQTIDSRAQEEHQCVPVWLKDADYISSYHNYCKQVLWPTFHYTLPGAQGLAAEEMAFKAYVEVNQSFADRIVEVYKEGDIVWVQDYHLLLVPSMVRKKLPRATIGLFVHIAFPSSEFFRCLSRREELLRGMLGADLIGFQTHNFCRHFRLTVSRILQLEVMPRGIQLPRAFVTVAPFPIGIDVKSLNRKMHHPEVQDWVDRLRERFAEKYVIVGRDKLDWIKGVREKLLGFEVFLDQHPDWVGRVVLIQVALATVQENKEVGEATDIVSRINRKHSSLTYQPVVFLHVQELTFSQYLALLTMADAFLATSLREGMNLTSHEYVIAQESRKRPLILSEFTGTYSTLRACIGINPWNTHQVANAIHQALTMPAHEREQRWYDLHRTVVTQTAQHWILSVLSQVERAHERQPSTNNVYIPRLEVAQLVSEWRVSRSRLLLVDLEGTLLASEAFYSADHVYQPEDRLKNLLQCLTQDPRNYVYLLSGQGTRTLDSLAQAVPQVGLIAEHGCFIRHSGQDSWTSLVDGFNLDWREPVLKMLSHLTDRGSAAWVEEHHACVTFHYHDAWQNSTEAERRWTRWQVAEVQSLISETLGDRYSLRILQEASQFTIMPKNVSRATAIQYVLSLDAMGALPAQLVADQATEKDMFTFVLQIGSDESLISYLNHLDLTFAPRTCVASECTQPSTEASYRLSPGQDVMAALEEIVDLRKRDLKWGGPATLDV
ncbi:hypothetical protein MYAM1_003244 [Malassezia yamatoensis]|uniref:Trehalose-phosphatase n=1 Tax=Malassezia yamatoensis TaxID=253288 RepID=A0AAJ5Z1D4_9BASI|nr:hypothetical protein MYAM1_003244 [Malassezia yamatoensis]